MGDSMLWRNVLKTVLSCWAISIPLRMIAAYVEGGVYVPVLFDVAVDWTPLLVFGLWMFAEGVRGYYRSFKVGRCGV
jgi:hypothetical protein